MPTRVKAPCVKAVLARATRRGEDSESVASIAERAGKSPRTIYRIMDTPDSKSFALDQADRLLLAAGGHLSLDCGDDDIVN